VTIWHILWLFGICSFPVLVCSTNKNLATLSQAAANKTLFFFPQIDQKQLALKQQRLWQSAAKN
jgi:hypothetical protein